MSTYTPSLGLELITPGSQAGLWGNTTNNTFTLIDQAITGVTPINFASASGSTHTLTDYNGAEDEARAAVLNVIGTAIGSNTIVIPNKQKTYYVRNNTGQDVTLQTLLGTTPCTVGAGYNIPVFCDGNNNVYLAILAPGASTLTVTGGGTGATTFGSGGFVKSSGGTNALTASATISASTEVSGTLPVANGGTGVTSFTSGAVLLGNGSGNLSTVTGSSSGQVLTWNGSNWAAATPATGSVTSVFGRTGAITAVSSDYSSFYYPLSSNPSGYLTSASLSGYATQSFVAANYGALASGNTWSSSNTFAYSPTANLGAVNITNNGASAACLNLYSTPSGDVSRGGEIKMTNGNAASNVRNKWLRVSAFGDLQLISSDYSNGIFFVTDSGILQVTSNIITSGGDGFKPGGGSWAVYSDARLKNNAQPLTGALEKITALNPVTYSWKYKTSEITTGFIAQEVKQVMPTAVGEAEPLEDQKPFIPAGEKALSVSWKNDMMAYLVGAIKELKAELDTAKAEIAALKAAK